MDEKVIHVDPAALKLSDNRTRKKREKKINPKIQIKNSNSAKKPKVSTLKRNLLNMIRSNQEKRLKNEPSKKMEEILTPPKSDFEDSIKFLSNLASDVPPPKVSRPTQIVHNRTFKQPSPVNPFPTSSFLQEETLPVPTINAAPLPWGNLKNGSKPTYRTWKNQTQKMLPPQSRFPPKPKLMDVQSSPIQINYEAQLNDKIKEMSEREQYANMKKQKPAKRKGKKQKRTVRRTYRVGKSKAHPRVSILVANKTLRNEANLKKNALKETPINEVKNFLRKQGFIKVGTTTPNDVIRQMYENVKMVCGEVNNHNPDNLLYNYFNDTNETFY